jgi:hypothetical protein
LFPRDCYDPDTIDLMTQALDAACDQVLARGEAADGAMRMSMEIRIMAAVRGGERDNARLAQIALEGVGGL